MLKTSGKQAIAMPRGSGKTTIIEGSIVWALLNGWRRHVVVLSANTKEARKILRAVGQMMRFWTVVEDYPESCYPLNRLHGSALLARGQLLYGMPTAITLGADSMTLPTVPDSPASGSVITALGINAAIRGQSEEQPDGSTSRPDFILLDDLQTDQVAVNPNRVRALAEKIETTVAGLRESGTEISEVMACTVIEPGDLSDLYLDREIHPQWHGLRFGLLNTMPERLDLWREYRAIRWTDPRGATDYYRQHRADMVKGAVSGHPDDYPAATALDAIEYAMQLWSDNERAFWAEQQNRPIASAQAAIIVPARQIMRRLSGYKRGQIPTTAVRVTAFVDIHDDIEYYAIIAWDAGFTGWIIDYGTFPEQRRNYFAKSDHGLEVLRDLYPGATADGALLRGLVLLLAELGKRQYKRANGYARIDRILVDSKYKPDVVEGAIRQARQANIVPARGTGVKATNRPMAQWPKRPGRIFGHHWIDEKIENRALRSVLIDTNYWKSRVHEAFALEPGERGSLSLFGDDPGRHRMIAEHCNGESAQMVSSGENEVYEWKGKPTRPDNHLFDCLTGNFAAASTLGLVQIL